MCIDFEKALFCISTDKLDEPEPRLHPISEARQPTRDFSPDLGLARIVTDNPSDLGINNILVESDPMGNCRNRLSISPSDVISGLRDVNKILI